ncbi:MAG: hypothetical protein HYY24_23805 [Verrucomicrobia bacterium]|nr:hypothetical protein [Verrucomicrobiota bacterium]
MLWLSLLCFLIGPAVVAGLCWLTRRFRYEITAEALEVRLFGHCVRRLALIDIRAISKRRVSWCEQWWNTNRPQGRILVLHRHTGFFKHFVVTPRKRYVFKTHLERAIRQLHAAQYQASEEFDESDAAEQTAGEREDAVRAGELPSATMAPRENELPRAEAGA